MLLCPDKDCTRHMTARVHHVARRAPIFVYLLSRTFFPIAVRTYSSCSLLSVCRSTNPLLTSRSIGRRSLSPLVDRDRRPGATTLGLTKMRQHKRIAYSVPN
jgi:hypothetical protein